MDEVIDVTRADKGFLILMESNLMRVKVARNLQRLSDSIVRKVIKSQAAADHRRRARRPRVQRL
jgi:hypothetical protein